MASLQRQSYVILLLGVLCTLEDSVRPASVAEVREILFWGRSRTGPILPFAEDPTLNSNQPSFRVPEENPPMPYVESSQFRKNTGKTEGAAVPPTKKPTGKITTVPEKVKPEKRKMATKKLQDEVGPIPHPPVWSHALISDELADPFGRLPSNEEYDRNSRFSHSILYGFDTGF